jgi:small ligand-binding sensory domain FIST
MTRILLAGMALAIVLLALGMSVQSFAMSMPDKAQNAMLSYELTKDSTQQQLMLVSDPLTSKGDRATFHLVL